MANLKTLAHQFQFAGQALHEAENHIKARYCASAISHAFQVPLRATAHCDGPGIGSGLTSARDRNARRRPIKD